MSGGDYGDYDNYDEQFVNQKQWSIDYNEYARDFNWGVITATNEFAKQKNVSLHITWKNKGPNCKNIPAWYMIKPHT